MASAGELTQKQENFCRHYIECGNASESYRFAYDCKNMKPETINRNAHALLSDNKVSARIEQLREAAARRNEITVDSLIDELEEARALARDIANPSAMVSATMGKAKITGFDKKIIQHQNASGGDINPVTVNIDKDAIKQAIKDMESDY